MKDKETHTDLFTRADGNNRCRSDLLDTHTASVEIGEMAVHWGPLMHFSQEYGIVLTVYDVISMSLHTTN